MRIRVPPAIVLAAALCGGVVRALGAQATGAAAPTGAFIGRVITSIDSSPAQSVEVRLIFVDSSKTRPGTDQLEVYVDSLTTRIGVTDSTGGFAIRRLVAGHYLLRFRRIGFQEVTGVLSVGADTVHGTFIMEVVSAMLAKVMITESSIDRVKEELRHVGYTSRRGLGISKTFIDRKEILHRRSDTVGQLLSAYGIHDGDFLLDRMPLSYDDIREYPAELVIGIEIYRHSRPTEFNMTLRQSANVFSTGGRGAPLVVIWTYIPGR